MYRQIFIKFIPGASAMDMIGPINRFSCASSGKSFLYWIFMVSVDFRIS
jgi:hypothetical protein